MIGTVLVFIIINALAVALGEFLLEEGTLGAMFWNLITFVISAWLSLGMIRIFLDISDGKDTSVKRLFSQGALLFSLVVASILYGLAVVAGTILLIVPGIYLAVKMYFYDLAIVDRGFGPVEALKESWNMTRGKWWSVFGLLILLFIFNIAGLLALFIGFIVTFPISVMALVLAYKTMASESYGVREDSQTMNQEVSGEASAEQEGLVV